MSRTVKHEVAVDACVRCHVRQPGATPWLCRICLNAVVKAMKDADQDDPRALAAARSLRNRVQRGARRAWRRWRVGRLPGMIWQLDSDEKQKVYRELGGRRFRIHREPLE